MSEAEQALVEPTTQEATPETALAEEKVTFSDEQQKVFNDTVAKKAFETREAKRQAEDLQRQLDEAKAAIPQEQAPNVPKLPDPYDDNYEDQVAARDDAIRAKERFDARQSFAQTQREQAQAAQQREQQAALNNKVTEYSNRATALGVNAQELQAAGNLVSQYGINDQVTQFILGDDQGPLITQYLSKNPMELETIRTLDPMQAAIHISSNIKSKAAALGVRTPTAPDPAEILRGSGVAPSKRGPKGATFE